MKSAHIVLAVAGAMVIGGIAYAFLREAAPGVEELAVTEREELLPSSVVHVDEMAEEPGRYNGEILLRAVVAGVNKEEEVVGVIDARELEACGVLSCAKYTVPVKHDGPLPTPRDIVQLRGRIVEGSGGLVFEARDLESIP